MFNDCHKNRFSIFVFIVIIESVLFLTLYFTFLNERVDEVMKNLSARGNTHNEVLADRFEQTTLQHVEMVKSASMEPEMSEVFNKWVNMPKL